MGTKIPPAHRPPATDGPWLLGDRWARPRGLSDMDPLPDVPHAAARWALHCLALALAAGQSLRTDPHARVKAVTFDRLVCSKMPILCTGPTGLHTIERPEFVIGPEGDEE